MNESNHLASESSPYLLQHANNPVDWYPWGETALTKARTEDKMMLISIGYSACHWCHVMEHESFEDAEVAELMNRFFVCIKVDREERPDIDQVYMTAVQLMTGKGGWPLNCFTLPDGRPVYGGTYFPKQQWMNILLNIADGYKNDKSRFVDYATQLTEGIHQTELIPVSTEEPSFTMDLLQGVVEKWKASFDNHEGGPDRAPKFPLPNNYFFLLNYQRATNNEVLKNHITLTLQKMAFGGIYDQVGGGFSRYSVDAIWKVPHFEKMLYDNAQLISLYSEAYKQFKDPLYRDIVYQTLDFIKRELTGDQKNFYSALDADSEGVEGKYYTWTKKELQEILGTDFDFFATVFNVNPKGYWEHDTYILLRNLDDEQLSKKLNLELNAFRLKVQDLSKRVLTVRANRVPPGLDDKTLLSWNALMVTAYLDAYDAFGETAWRDQAAGNIRFVLDKMTSPDGGLFHNYKNNKATINGFLEDYAFFIYALIRMYQVTFDILYLNKAKHFTEYTLLNFSDAAHELFYFSSAKDAPLITRSKEVQDNVIPASNSQMAINLFFLGHYFENTLWLKRSEGMLMSMKGSVQVYGSGYSNWLLLWLYQSQPLRELVICGEAALTLRNDISKEVLPSGTITAGALATETLPMTEGRLLAAQTNIYVCVDKQCHLPVTEITQAINHLNS